MVDSTTNETYKWAEEAARPEGGLHQQPSTNKYFPQTTSLRMIMTLRWAQKIMMAEEQHYC